VDNTSLDKYFNLNRDPDDTLAAYDQLRTAGRVLAETINKLLPESPSKGDIMGRLFRIVVDSELAIRMDGTSNTQNLILTKH
jgi:hypothetical protein